MSNIEYDVRLKDQPQSDRVELAPDAVRTELCELLRQFICEFWVDKPQMMWKRSRCDDGLEMVHHAGDTIFFGDANHKEPSDTKRFDLIVELANAAPAMLRALSRQPQSNSEGEQR